MFKNTQSGSGSMLSNALVCLGPPRPHEWPLGHMSGHLIKVPRRPLCLSDLLGDRLDGLLQHW